MTLGALVAPSVSRAQDLYRGGTYTPMGASIGVLLDGTDSLLVGAEVSYVRMNERSLWYGFFVDVRWDEAISGAQFGLGTEGGWSIVGADVGFITRLGTTSAFGIRARACLCGGVLNLCAGAAAMTAGQHFAEVTLLLKYPRYINTDSQDRLEYPASPSENAESSDANP